MLSMLLLSVEAWCSMNVQTVAAPIPNIYFLTCWKFSPLSKQMLLTLYHFYSSTEPSGTQVERDNPLYESQVLRPYIIVQGIISTSPVQHPSVMQSMCYLSISAYNYLPLPHPPFLHSPYPLSSLPPLLRNWPLKCSKMTMMKLPLAASTAWYHPHLLPPPPQLAGESPPTLELTMMSY